VVALAVVVGDRNVRGNGDVRSGKPPSHMVTSPVAISYAVNMPSRRYRIFNFNVLPSHVLIFCCNIGVKGVFVDKGD